MKQMDHLQVYDLKLKTQAPLFIGSGEEYGKKEYLYAPGSRTVTFLNRHSFFDLLIQKNLVEAYENFMLGPDTSLLAFLQKTCGLSREEIRAVTSYSVNVGQALDAGHALKGIHKFVRNAAEQAYVPGSSVKGAIRTALLAKLMLDEDAHSYSDALRPDTENRYLHTLKCLKDRNGAPVQKNAVNSIMRGIQISDSLPIPDNSMTLGMKIDANVYGETHTVNVCRECIAPQTEVHMKLTLDQNVLQGKWPAGEILDAISRFLDLQVSAWAGEFDKPHGAAALPEGPYLFLGGGTGFASKTLDYAFYDTPDAVRHISENLQRSFRRHGHERDPERGVSPRMMKYTKYNGVYYPFGLCEVSLT